jgi:hypothetical protein
MDFINNAWLLVSIYCTSTIQFGDAVFFSGVDLIVKKIYISRKLISAAVDMRFCEATVVSIVHEVKELP